MTAPIRSDDLATIDEVRALLGVSRPTMRLIIAERHVRSIRIGARLFASRSDCEQLAKDRAAAMAARIAQPA